MQRSAMLKVTLYDFDRAQNINMAERSATTNSMPGEILATLEIMIYGDILDFGE